MRVDAAGRSDVGKVRSQNEDRFAIRQGLPDGAVLCVLADGMGGYAAGEVAATVAVEAVLAAVENGTALAAAVAEANAAVFRRAAADASHRGMGTTLTCVALDASRGHARFAHVGDSRLYLVREGTARQLSVDHSWVAEEVRAGRLTAEEARHSRRRNLITRALGLEDAVAADEGNCSLEAGDAILVCSDGVHMLASDDELAAACAGSAEQACADVLELVLARGAPDNATVIVARVLGDEAPPRPPITRPLPELAPAAPPSPGSASPWPATNGVAGGTRARGLRGGPSSPPFRRRPGSASPDGGDQQYRWWPLVLVLIPVLLVLGVAIYLAIAGGTL